MKVNINLIITALMELEAKGCHKVFFEYGNGLVRVRIFKGEVSAENVVFEKTINPVTEQAEMDSLLALIKSMSDHIMKTEYQCYRQEFVKGVKAGKWEKTRPVIEFGDKAMSSMLIDGSGYYIDDPENELLYFVDMKQLSETDK